MANCKSYQGMTPKERTDYIGSLIHSCISDDELFILGQKLIRKATRKGVFNGVEINPNTPPPLEIDPTTQKPYCFDNNSLT